MAAERNIPASSETDANQSSEFLPGFKDVKDYSQAVFRAMMMATKLSNDLPSAGDDYDYCSSYESFRQLMHDERSRVLHILQNVLRYHGARGTVLGQRQEEEEKFDALVDANDQLLERVGNYLDEAVGLRKRESPLVVSSLTPKQSISGSWNKKTLAGKKLSTPSFRLLSAKNIQRPQGKFPDKIDNSSRPFFPKIRHKPHAKKPLQESLKLSVEQLDNPDSIELGEGEIVPHPYQYELDNFKPTSRQLKQVTPQHPLELDAVPLTMVDTEAGLRQMCDRLAIETEVAIDLEHHSYRTFLGFACLMQVSTRKEDFIVDTLALRGHLHLLNNITTDPNIVKVLHGADSDMMWLQRDLGVYMVNLFDTGQAARVLSLPSFGLAHLLSTYCSVTAKKQYQLADWRIRPLPAELIQYAREDTHYLLYIYDVLKNTLINRSINDLNLLNAVTQRSKEIALKCYVKPVYSPQSHLDIYIRSRKVFNSQQLSALQAVYAWRDRMAREEDESTGYVLPNHMLLQISELIPREVEGVLACCNPVPPLVRQNLPELHCLIKAARETPLTTAPTHQGEPHGPTRAQHPKYDANSILHCPHDSSHPGKSDVAMETGLPTTNKSTMFKKRTSRGKLEVSASPLVSVFSWEPPSCSALKRAEAVRNALPNPFQQFLPQQILDKVQRHTTDSSGEFMSIKRSATTTRWRLLPNTTKPKPAVEVKQAPPKIVLPEMAPVPEAVNTDELMSVKQQINVGKKRHHAERSVDSPSTTDQPQEKKKKTGPIDVAEVEKDFTAFNYAATDYNKLYSDDSKQGKGRGKGKGHSKGKGRGKNRQQDFDPDEEQRETKYKSGSKPRLSGGRGGKKSMTYNKDKPTLSNIAWPSH